MSIAFAQIAAGTPLEPFELEISAAANDRYWDGAGVEHPLRTDCVLYPLIAANLTVLTFNQLCAEAMIQTRQRLVCHRRADAPATLRTTGFVSERYERRGRDYIVVETEVHERGTTVWSSTVVFTPAATLEQPQPKERARQERKANADATGKTVRSLHITEDLVRRYSRRGNFHSEHATSESLGLPGLVAQGTQATGPAYGLLLDAWGEEFLAHGELDVRFVGMVLADHTVTATVAVDGSQATIEILNETSGTTAVIGDARSTHREPGRG
jgi:acyl dehydratase